MTHRLCSECERPWSKGHECDDGPLDNVSRRKAEAAEPRAEGLREALDAIREICKPMSMTMSGPIWFDGGTPAGGGSRERIWRICDAALAPEPETA